MNNKTKKIIAIGGGGFTHKSDPILDKFVIDQCKQKQIKFGFLPTASEDNKEKINLFYSELQQYEIELSHFELCSSVKGFEKWLMSQDIIYIGGGNTKYMIKIWNDNNFISVFKDAYNSGIILSGISAGAVCWFDWILSDSVGPGYNPLRGINILSGSCTPHSSVPERMSQYQSDIEDNKLPPGIAIDDGVAVLFINGSVTWRFFNAPEQSSVTGNFAMVNSATRADTLVMMKTLQTTVDELATEYEKEHGRNPVKYVLAELGGNSGRGLSGTENKSKDLLGGISIELIDADLRSYSSFSFVGDLQDKIVRHPLVEAISFRGWRSGPGDDALDVQFYGADAVTLKKAAEALKTELEAFPAVSALEDDLAYDKEEIILELTPQGKALGFTIDTLGVVLRNRLNGVEAASYPLGPRSATIRVELPEGELTSDFLERTQLRAKSGIYVPLADIVSVERKVGFSTVRRENGIRLISVTGDVSEDNPEEAEQVFEALKEEILPEIATVNQVEWRMSGLAEQEQDFLNDARVGMILTLLGIYLVLTWIFASWTRPFVIMSIIPFGLVGTIYGHFIWDVPMSLFTIVGLIGMTGIIINDSIVLISTIDEYSKERGIIPSIIDGSVDRLRPVLLTTFTTVLGLAPLLYERSTQAQFLKPTVITLVYGLGFGLLIVLLVIPALVAMQEDIKRFRKAYLFALRSQNKFIQRSFVSLTLAIILWGVLTLGFMLVSESLAPLLSELNFIQALPETMLSALALFITGSFLLIFIFALVGYFMFWRSRNLLQV